MKIQSLNKTTLKPGVARVILVIVMVLAVLGLGVGGMLILKNTGPEADKEPPPKAMPRVKVITAKSADQQLYVKTQGEVTPLMSTQLSSDVMGKATMVSPKLKTGGVFEEGEVMLEVERSSYAAALARAESSLADAKLALEQEQSRAEQALRDWKKLGKGTAPNLVARKPQIISAKTRVMAAEADVTKAVKDLASTALKAPYRCQIDASYIDRGSHITMGMRLADVSSLDVREVRVPVPLSELGYLNKAELIGTPVEVSASIAGEQLSWKGKVTRNEGKIDRNTMMMHLVVEIAASENQKVEDLPPSGLFVDASITGALMSNVMELPRSALSLTDSVMVLDEDERLKILNVKVVRTMKGRVLISEGVPEGTRVIVSAIETAVPGMQLEVEQISNIED